MHLILKSCFLPAILTILCAGQCLASSLQCEVIRGEKKHNRIKLAFFAEGYTEADRDQYESDVNRIVDTLFSITPYKEYKEMFNVFRVWTPSKQSGIPLSNPDSTYFGSTISGRTFDISEKAFNTLHSTTIGDSSMFGGLWGMEIGFDIPVILVNCSSWAGNVQGSSIILCSPHPQVLPHEIGHLFGRLNDEYDAEYENGLEGPNTTSKTDPDSIPWRHWLQKDTPIPTPETETYSQVIGLFEGACYQKTGWYRPKLRCQMNDTKDPFCEVCREKLACEMVYRFNFKSKWFHMQVFDSLYPAPESTINNGTISVALASDSIPFSYSWYFNGKKLDNQSTSLDVRSLHGSGTIEFIIKDTIGFIIDTSFLQKYSSDTARWFYQPTGNLIKRNNAVTMNNSTHEIGDGVYFIPTTSRKNFSIYSLDGRKISLQKNLMPGKNGSIYNFRGNNAAAMYIVKYGTAKSVINK